MSEMSMARPVRKVAVADHIWDAFEVMALEMGSDRDGLINQAMFMFARLNGYLSTGTAIAPGVPAIVQPAPDVLRLSAEAPLEEQTPSPALGRRAVMGPPLGRPPPREPRLDPEPLSLRARGADLDAEPRRRIGETPGRAAPVISDPLPEPPPDEGGFDAPSAGRGMDNDPDRLAVAERVLETAAELERLIKGKQQQPGGQAELPPARENAPDLTPEPAGVAEKGLYLIFEESELDRIAKDRFLIGRGKHCDLVINSGKVSREHAAIVRENGEYFIEDLGSSNGTWFNKQRIKRQKIDDGDEYFICSDKVKCVFR